jgi:hypothetical protein
VKIDGYPDPVRLSSGHVSSLRSQQSQQLSAARQLDPRAIAQAISESRTAPSAAALQKMADQASASAAGLADSDPLKSFATRLSKSLSTAGSNSLGAISDFSQFQSAAGTAYQQLTAILQQTDGPSSHLAPLA